MNPNSSSLRAMFDGVAKQYVRLNAMMTFGRDQGWRKKAADFVSPKPGDKILDICTGTGDLAIALARRFPKSEVVGLDFSPKMLSIARDRANRAGTPLEFIEGDVTNLPFDSGSIDCVTVSFGFRNLSFSKNHLDQALREIYRVLKEGGQLIVLETSQPSNRWIRAMFHFYAATIVPMVGRFIAHQRESYRYLGSSIQKFFDQDELMGLLKETGFQEERTQPLMFGMVLLCGVKKGVNKPIGSHRF